MRAVSGTVGKRAEQIRTRVKGLAIRKPVNGGGSSRRDAFGTCDKRRRDGDRAGKACVVVVRKSGTFLERVTSGGGRATEQVSMCGGC